MEDFPPNEVRPVASIVIPAHDEAGVLGANLRVLLEGTSPGEFDVIVVANACSDATAQVARSGGVRVVETDTPGKPHALRLGDAQCLTFPRIYLDADVRLDADSVRALVAASASGQVLACAPVPELDLSGVGRLARRVHRVHEQLIRSGRALAGVGAYVLTEAGHARVFPMPDVISDDGFVHGSFTPSERVVVPTARTVVRPARSISAHLNRRVRVRRGNRELAALGKAAPEGRLGPRVLVRLVAQRTVGPVDASAYVTVLLLDRFLTRVRQRRVGDWGHDASTRT